MVAQRRSFGLVAAAAALGSVSLLGASDGAKNGRTDRIEIGSRAYDRVEVRVSELEGGRGNVALDMSRKNDVIAVWDSHEGEYGVFSRRIDGNGLLRGEEQRLGRGSSGLEVQPAVSIGADGQPWFSWTSYGRDGSQGAVVGKGPGEEAILNTRTEGDQGSVVTTFLANGHAVIVWSTPGETEPETHLAYRIVDAQGRPLSEEQAIDVGAGMYDRVPAVAAAGDGTFLVAWGRAAVTGQILGIYARRFNQDGVALGGSFVVSEPGADNIEPAVAADARGNYLVAWVRLDPVTDYDVMLRRYAPGGQAIGPPVCAQADRTGWQSACAVAATPSGAFVVAWNTNSDDDSDIFVRYFDAGGTPTTNDLRINRETRGRQLLGQSTGAKRIALGADGRLAVAWEGDLPKELSGEGGRTANVTLLVPVRGGIEGALTSTIQRTVRSIRNGFEGDERGERERERNARAARPHVPPTFDPTQAIAPSKDVTVVHRGGEVGFDGFVNTGWVPPDPHMAVGTDHVCAIVNGGIRVFTKTGTSLWQLDINGGAGFWGPVGAGSEGGFVFDSEVLWDVFENRFIAMANERNGSGGSYFLLAISQTSDASDPNLWYKYRLNVTPIAGSDIDSPNMSVDASYIYLSADFFGPDRFLVYNIQKASVINGGTPVTTSFLRTGTQSFGMPSMYTADAPRMYMIEHFDSEPSSQIRLWAINDPGGTPTLMSTMVTVPTYFNPGDSRSQGTGAIVELFESRFWSCMYRDGSLWACHHVSLASSPRLAVARWYEFKMNGWPTSGNPPTLNQSGTVTAGTGIYLTFNSIFADANGNTVMVFARSASTEFYSISRAYRTASDPLGTMHGPDFVKQSTVAYGQNRWGDYSAIVADPATPDRFWMHHEYAPGWRTWIQSETISPVIAVGDIASSAPTTLRINPSPTSGPASFSFTLDRVGQTRLEIYSAAGQLVRAMDLGSLGATTHLVDWDGQDNAGADVAAGVYLSRIVAGGAKVAEGRLVVTR